MKVYEFSSIDEYFSKYIDILTIIKDMESLAPREKRFLLAYMICEYRGIDINSERGQLTVKEYANAKNKDGYTYPSKLIEKGWLIRHQDGELVLPEVLSCIRNKGIQRNINFRFTLAHVGQD